MKSMVAGCWSDLLERVGQSTRHATSSSERLRERIVRGTIVVPSPKNFENLKKFSVFQRFKALELVQECRFPCGKLFFLTEHGNIFQFSVTVAQFIRFHIYRTSNELSPTIVIPVWSRLDLLPWVGYQSYPIEDSVLSFKYLSSTRPLPSCLFVLNVPANMLIRVVRFISQCCSFLKLLRLFRKACHRTRGW